MVLNVLKHLFLVVEYTGPVRRETLAAIDRRITVRRQTQANIQKNLSDNLSLLGHDNRAYIEEKYGRNTDSQI